MVRYEFQQRTGGRGAVVRVGPKGGRKSVLVYKDQQTASEMVAELNRRAAREA